MAFFALWPEPRAISDTLTSLMSHAGLVAFQIVKYRARTIARRKSLHNSKHKYAKIPTIVDDSGVVLNTESSITMRTVVDDGDEEEQASEYVDEDMRRNGGRADEVIEGVHAHKAVVGPDELLPGDQEPMPKNGEKMVGFTQALMWLPAIFDVSFQIARLSCTLCYMPCRLQNSGETCSSSWRKAILLTCI